MHPVRTPTRSRQRVAATEALAAEDTIIEGQAWRPSGEQRADAEGGRENGLGKKWEGNHQTKLHVPFKPWPFLSVR